MNKPSAKLVELMDYVNLVPRDFELPDIKSVLVDKYEETTGYENISSDWILQQAVYEEEYKLEFIEFDESNNPPLTRNGNEIYFGTGSHDAFLKTFDVVREILKDYPQLLELILYSENNESFMEVTDSGAADPKVFHVWENYHQFQKIRENFFSLVSDINNFQLNRNNNSNLKMPYRLYIPSIPYLDKKGKLYFQNDDSLLKILEGAEAKRLKQCEVCEKAFWAYRLNQKWCSQTCKSTHFQRERRADFAKRDEINQKRRVAYQKSKD